MCGPIFVHLLSESFFLSDEDEIVWNVIANTLCGKSVVNLC
jgi:hypothetical protein